MGVDLLAPVAALPGVAEAAASARDEVDRLLWDRRLPRRPDVARSVAILDARASAELDGIVLRPLEFARLVGVPDQDDAQGWDRSPITRAGAAAWRVASAMGELVATMSRAPLQVFATLATAAGAGFVPPESLGRPRTDDSPDDPLRLGALPPLTDVGPRLDQLSRLIVAPTAAPALVVAAIVHGEILTLRPFGWGSGLVARAAWRLAAATKGVDPDLLVMADVGLLQGGRPGYVDALRGFASGTPEGVAAWVRGCCLAIEVGARESRAVIDAPVGVPLL